MNSCVVQMMRMDRQRYNMEKLFDTQDEGAQGYYGATTTSYGGIIFSTHMGNISERTHSLAVDIKLNAHGRHPTAYPLKFLLISFLL
jgi:hypothetical protein